MEVRVGGAFDIVTVALGGSGGDNGGAKKG
jgi:hypothetical protein